MSYQQDIVEWDFLLARPVDHAPPTAHYHNVEDSPKVSIPIYEQ